MGEILLAGCTAEPLMGYLKAIGLLRIVADQLDPTVTARWAGDTFCLGTDVGRDELVEFMLHGYSPAPIITPWNKGSGFAPGDVKSSPQAFRNVAAIETSADVRLAQLQAAIAAGRQAVGSDQWEGLAKADQVSLLRRLLPDEALGWLDAAVVLTTDGRAFPPLLGTGGNDGRFDFGSNYLDRVATVIGAGVPPRSLADRRALLTFSLFAEGVVKLDQAAIGQFDPAASGGPGSSPFGKAESLANPWDLVLLFEGAIAFASGVARKFGAAHSSSAVPFTVAGVSAGYATSVVESCRGEFWAPIWRRSASAAELLRFIAEGRAEFGGRQARDGLDVARALATLGVDRGIDEFVRFAFLERNGLATFCIPVGRQKVATSERHDVAAFKQLDPWLNPVRRTKNLPASAAALLRRIDGQQFAVTQHAGPRNLQELLGSVSDLEQLASRSRALREQTDRWVEGLRADSWLPHLADESVEFEIALALASLRSPGDRWGWLRPLWLDSSWSGRRVVVDGCASRPLAGVLADTLGRLVIDRGVARGAPLGAGGCFGPAAAQWASTHAVTSFLGGACDDDRIGELVRSLLMLDWRGSSWRPAGRVGDLPATRAPLSYAVLAPLFHHTDLSGRLPEGRPLRPYPETSRLLEAGRPERAIELGLRALRLSGASLLVPAHHSVVAGVDSRRLAAACLIPISDVTAVQLLKRVATIGDETTKEQP